jgi:hypothetical protein
MSFSFHEKPKKRNRLLEDMSMLDPIDMGGPQIDHGSGDEPMFPVSFDEITAVQHMECYACNHITAASIGENPYHSRLVRLYTENSTTICKDAIYSLVKRYFDEEIRADVGMEWPLPVIKEHFLCHTMYPTDEVLTQINITAGLRRNVMNNLIKRDESGANTKVDMNNAKLLISLNKELRILRQLKGDIPSMLGYDANLNY